MRKDTKQVLVNMVVQTGAFLIQSLIAFLITPLLVKKLGLEAYGFIGLSTNILMYLEILTIALTSMSGRYIALSFHSGNFEQAKKYFSSVFLANTILGMLILVISSFIIIFLPYLVNIPSGLEGDVKMLFGILALGNVVTLSFNVYAIAPFIRNRLELTSFRNLISKGIYALTIIVFFALLPAHLYFVGIASLAGSIFVAFENVRLAKKLTPELMVSLKHAGLKYVKEVAISGSWNLVTRAARILDRGLELLLANLLVGNVQMSMLSIAAIVPSFMETSASMISTASNPQITKKYAQGDVSEMMGEVYTNMQIMAVFTITAMVVLYVCGLSFYKLWMPGEDYNFLFILTVLGTINFLLTLPSGVFYYLFTVTNNIKLPSIYALCNSIATVITVLALISVCTTGEQKIIVIAVVRPIYSIGRGLIFQVWYGCRCVGWKARNTFLRVGRNALTGIVIYIVLAQINTVWQPHSWVSLITQGITVGTLALVATFFLVLNRNERQAAMQLISKRNNK